MQKFFFVTKDGNTITDGVITLIIAPTNNGFKISLWNENSTADSEANCIVCGTYSTEQEARNVFTRLLNKIESYTSNTIFKF